LTLMSHLTPEELLDLAEGAQDEASAPHLTRCQSCRGQLADLRAAMAAVSEIDVPEPSPLFWEHLSARVREAIAPDAAPRVSWIERWFSWKIAVPATAGVVTLLAVAVTMHGPRAPETTVRQTVSQQTSDQLVRPADDLSWSLMTDIASDLDWEAAVEAGLTTPAGGVDRAVFDLNADERRALRRLLQVELAGSGA
jgi:hypothetical protein